MTTPTIDRADPAPTRRTSGARSPRGRRGAVATFVALIAVLGCVFGAIEAVSLAMHRRTVLFDVAPVARFGRDTQLQDTVVLIVAVAAFVVGVLMVLAALIPPRRRLIELAEPDPSIAAGLTRRSFHRTLAAAAVGVDGISAATVSGRRRLKVKATTAFRKTDALPDRVRDRVTARLDELDPVRARRVRVALIRKDA